MSERTLLRAQLVEVRLPRWHRWVLYAGFVLVAATGVVWTFSHDVLALGPNILERAMLKVHGASSFMALMLFGSVVPHHMRLAWNARRNRTTGALVVSFFLVLAVSAYGLYYAGEDLREFTRWLHIYVGILGCVALPLHIRVGRRNHF